MKQCAVSPSELIANSLTLKQFYVNLFSVLQDQQEKKAWKIPHLKHVLLKQQLVREKSHIVSRLASSYFF